MGRSTGSATLLNFPIDSGPLKSQVSEILVNIDYYTCNQLPVHSAHHRPQPYLYNQTFLSSPWRQSGVNMLIQSLEKSTTSTAKLTNQHGNNQRQSKERRKRVKREIRPPPHQPKRLVAYQHCQDSFVSFSHKIQSKQMKLKGYAELLKLQQI